MYNTGTNVDETADIANEIDDDEDLLNAFMEATRPDENAPQAQPAPVAAQQGGKQLSAYETELLAIEREKLELLKTNKQPTAQPAHAEDDKFNFKVLDDEVASEVAGYVQHETARVRAQLEAEARAAKAEYERQSLEAQRAAEEARVKQKSTEFTTQIANGNLFKGQTEVFWKAVETLQKPENSAFWQGVTTAMHNGDVGAAEDLFRIILKKAKRPMSTASVSAQGGGGISRPTRQAGDSIEDLYNALLTAEKEMYRAPENIKLWRAHQDAHARYLAALG